VLSCFMVLPAALEAAEAATILHEITLILDAELVKCQSRPGVIPVVLKTPASEEVCKKWVFKGGLPRRCSRMRRRRLTDWAFH
jgi:hypothetical protein